MNSSYRLVYSEVHKTWVAVAEHVSARGKKGTLRLLTNIALLATGATAAPWAMATAPPVVTQLPTGAKVAAGSVAISQTQTAAAARMAVLQSSNQAIVNWQSFNVGANATVTIQQPSSSSVLLSRVLDSNPSQIFGQIKANGQVFLTNPSGVYFAPGSSVDVGSFTATTHGISDSDFLTGKFNFSRNSATGTITNQGSITAGLGGYIALLAPEVRNQGVVLAQRGGTVALAAGESYQLQINSNNQLTNVLVTPSTINTLVENANAVQAPGGVVILSAQAASSLLGGVVKNSGDISATGLVSDGGVIRLRANNKIELAPTSRITADAAPGSAGTGGRIEVIADLANLGSHTQVDGTLSAKAGEQGGDGGFVETSASRLNISGTTSVSTLAPQGTAGTWLLDPTDFTIAATGGDITGTTVANNLRSGNVTITSASGANGTTGDINLNENVAWSANVLTLTATNNVNINANLSGSGTADLTINGNGLSGSGDMSVGDARTLTVNQSGSSAYSGVMSGSGNLLLTGAGTLNLSGNNSFTGYTWIKSGILQLGSGSTLGNTSAIRLSSNTGSGRDYRYTEGTLDLNGQTVTNTALPLVLLAPSGSNRIVNTSAGKASFAGPVNPNSGVVTFVMTGGEIEMSGAMGGLAVGGYAAGGYTGLQLEGSHALTLSGTTPRTWNGSTASYPINPKSESPTLKITGAFGPDINRLNGAMTLDYESASDLNITSDIAGAALAVNIIKGGAGTLTLSGRNFSSGTITVNAGTLAMSNNTLPNLTSITVNSGSTLDLKNVSIAKPVILDGGALTASTGSSTLSGSLTLGDNSTVGGAGAITLSGAITSNGYGLALVGAGAKTLSSTSNSLTTIATSAGVGAVTVVNNAALTIGQVTADGTTYGGIDSTGAVKVTTRNANLTVTQPVTTTSAAANAVQLLVSAGYSVLNVTPIYLLPASGLTGEYGIAPLLNYWYSSSPSSVVSVAYTGIPSTVQSFSLASGAVANTINIADGVAGTLSLTGSPGIAADGLVATTNAGTYSLTLSPSLTLSGYAFYAGNAVNYTINPKAVTVTSGSRSTTYDGTTTYASLGNASTFSTSALVGSDSVASVTQSAVPTGVAQAGSFNVRPSAAVMGTGLASNYAFSYAEGMTTVAKATASVVGGRTYDGTSTLGPADLTVSGVNGETLALTGVGTATATSKNVADNASNYISSFATLTLADGTGLASNYQLPANNRNDNNRVALSQANLTLAPVSDAKTYDRTVDSSATVSVTGKAATDTVTVAEQFDSKNAQGSNASTLSIKAGYTIVDGANADMSGNYNITATATATGTISKADLSVSGLSAQNKTYDAGTSATLSGTATITPLSGDTVTLDGSAVGNFANKNAGEAKAVTVSGQTLGGTDAGNYILLQQSGLSADITQATITVFGLTAANKTYDAGTSASLSGTAAITVLAGDTVTLDGSAVGNFANKNAGAAKAVTVSGQTLGGTDAGNYNLLQQSGLSADITQATITVSGLSASSKTYDTNTSVTLSGAPAITALGSDTVTLGGSASGAFADKNVGTGKTITITGNTISGTDAANYTLVQQSGLSANITQASLAVTGLSASNKTYDTNTSVTLSGAPAIAALGSDTVTLGGSASGAFADKNVGTGKTITITGNTISGTDAANYTLVQQSGLSANITQANLTVFGLTAANKTYDTTTAATLGGAAAVTALTGDTVVLGGTAVGAFANKNAGTGKAVTITGNTISGADAANYTLVQQSGLSADITQANLTVFGLTATNKTYDTTTAAPLGGAAAAVTALAGDTVVLGGTAVGAFANKNAGTGKAITITGNTISGTDAANYVLVQQTGLTANIAQASIAVSGLTAASKTYDATTIATLDGTEEITALAGDTVTLGGTAVGAFTDKNAGTAKTVTVTGNTLSGTDAANYTLAQQSGLSADITKASLTVSGLAATNKTYDASTSATLSGTAAITALAGDAVTLGGVASGSFDNKNVGVGKTVVVTGNTISGTDAANYTLVQQSALSADITQASLTISGLTATNKTYDTTTAAALGGTAAITALAGDTVTLGGTAVGAFTDKNAGTAKAITVTGNTLSGTDAANYTLAQQSGLSADITKASLTVSGLAATNKTYDASTSATLSGTAAITALAGDAVTLGGVASGSFDNKNVGVGKAVVVTGNTISGADAANYTLVQQSGLSADITQASLTISGLTAINKTYDTTATAPLGGTAAITTLGSDTVTLGGSAVGTFANKNAGAAKAVTVSGNTISGPDAANYHLLQQSGLSANIDKADLRISGLSAKNKTYDSTTSATLEGTAAISALAGDTVTLGGSSVGSFADKNAGAAKAITLSGNTISGADAANYNLLQQSGLTATITQANLSVRANDDARFVTQADSAGYNGVAYSGFVGGEVAASSDLGGALLITRTSSLTDVAAATYTGALHASGLSSGNYAISYLSGDYTIVPAQQLLVRVANESTVYGSAATYSISSAQYLNGANVLSDLNLVNSSGATSTYSDGIGGSATFTLAPSGAVNSTSGHVPVGVHRLGASSSTITGSNFNALTIVGAQTVTQKTLSVAYTGLAKTYDATRNASVSITDDRVTGDVLSLAHTAAFADKNVGAAKAISISGVSLSGTDAANYTVSSTGAAAANITQANLVVSGLSATGKTYDSNRTAALTGSAAVTALAGDTVTLGGTAVGAFADKDAGTAKAVTVSGNTLSGADAANYVLVQQTGLTATVSQAPLNLAISKTYDGNTAFSGANSYSLSGMVGGDARPSISAGAAAVTSTSVASYSSFASNTLALSDRNYTLNSGTVAATIGQLASVAFTGASGGNWSLASNWAGGAIPTLDNVASVVIPVGTTVVYDQASLIGLTPSSAIANSGSLNVVNASDLTLTGALSGAGALTKGGAGALTLSGANTYLGATAVNTGTLRVTGSLADTTAVSVASGSSYRAAASDTIGALSGAGGVVLESGVTLSTGANNSSTSLSGAVSGAGALAKQGTGTFTLSGNNLFGGGATVNAGTLALGSANALGSGAATVASGAALDLQGNSVANALTLSGTGVSAGGLSGALYNSSGNAATASGAITLAADTLIKNTGALSLSTIDGAYALTLRPTGTLTLAGNIGLSSAPTSLSTVQNLAGVSGTGTTVLGATTVKTTGAQTYGNLDISTSLAAPTTLRTLGGNVQVLGTINAGLAGGNLAVHTGAGNLTLGSARLDVATGSLDLSAASNRLSKLTIASAGSVEVANTLPLELGTSLVSGSLTLGNKNAAITQSGFVRVMRDTLFEVDAATITLDKVGAPGNMFGGTLGRLTLINSGDNDIKIYTPGSLRLDHIDTGTGALDLRASDIRQSNASASVKMRGTVTSNSTDLIFDAPITLDAPLSINTGTNKLTLNSTVAAGTNKLSVTADSLDLSGATLSGSSFALTTSTAGKSIVLGSTSDSTAMAISASDFTKLMGMDSLSIGDSTSTNPITVSSALTVSKPMTVTITAGGSFTVNNQITVSNGTFTVAGSGHTTHLNADIVTDSQAVYIQDSVILGANVKIDTTNGGTSAGAAVTIAEVSTGVGGTVNSDSSSTRRNLTVTAGTGAASFAGMVGGSVALGALDITAAGGISLPSAVTTYGSQTYRSAVGLPQATTLTSNDYAVTFASTVNSASAAAQTLTVAAGTGDITFSDAVGASYALGGLSLSGAAITAPVLALSGDLDVSNTAASTVSGAVSGSGGLSKAGAGTLSLSGANTYSGDTTVSAGTLQLASSASLGGGSYAGDIALSSGAVLQYSSDALQTLSGTISGAGSFIKDISAGTLILSGSNTYTGGTTIGAGTLQAGSSSALGAAAVTVGSSSSSAASLDLNGNSLGNTLTLYGYGSAGEGGSVGALTNSSATAAAASGAVTLGSATAMGGSGDLTVSGAVAASGNALLIVGAGASTLDNSANTLSTIATDASVGALSVVNRAALTVGTVTLGSTNYSGVSSTGAVAINTTAGDLTVGSSVATTGSSLVLGAGSATAVGTSTGGDVLISGSPAISVGTGGTAIIYSGSVAGSTGVSAAVGSGSGKFRYNSKQGSGNYSAALGTGLSAVYREQPTLTISVDAASSIVYGASTPSFSSAVSAQNGDTAAQALSTAATVTAGGTTSSAGYLSAGTHTLTAAGAVDQLGYAIAYSSNTLSVTQASLTVSGLTASNKTYDASTSATLGGTAAVTALSGDTVTLGGTAVGVFGDKNVGTVKAVTVTGNTLSGTDAANYALVQQAGLSADITQATLSVTGLTASNKTYDTTTAATLGGTASITAFSGDTVTLGGTAVGTFTDKNAGTGKTVTVTGSTISGTDAANYALVQQAGLSADITRANLSVSGLTAANKTYDSMTAAILGGTAAITALSGDAVTLGGTAVGSFVDKNAGTAKAVAVTGNTISGSDAANYALAQQTGLTADITQASLSVTGLTAISKTYDTTTSATLGGTAAITALSGDTVTLDGSAAGSFADKNVGTAKAVTVTGNTLSGMDAANYVLSQQAGLAADITQASLSVTGLTAANKTYDTTTAATLGGTASITAFSGDTVTLGGTAVGTFADKNAGTSKVVTVTCNTISGTDAANYVLSQQSSLTADITQASLSVTGLTAISKTYDTTTSATLGGTAAISALPGDTVALGGTAVGIFADKNAGMAKAVTVTGNTISGADAANYALAQQSSLTADITQARLSVTGLTASNKTYDTTTSATLGGTARVTALSGDTATLDGTAVGSFADKNVGTAKAVTVTGNTLSGMDAANYVLSQQAGLAADVTQARLSVTGLTASNKTYDTTTAATLGGTASITAFSGDTVTLGGTAVGTFADKNAGTSKVVTVTGNTISGTDAANYVLSQQSSLTADITQASLSVTGLTASNKTYDTTTAATLVGTAAITALSGDTVTLGGTAVGTFADKNAGDSKTVTVTGNTISGTDAANYVLSPQAGLTADITQASLSVTGLTAINKTYDTMTAATLGGTASITAFSGDTVILGGTAVGTFADKNAGTAKTVTVAGNTISGMDAANYVLNQQAGLTADVTQASLTITGLTASNKTYDTTTGATLRGTARVTALSGDTVTLDGSAVGSFADKNAGMAKAVTVTGNTLSGVDADNYALLQQSGLSANITPATLTVTANNDSKLYDGVAYSGGAGVAYSGFVGGESSLVLSGGLGYSGSSQNARNAGSYTVTPKGLTSTNYAVRFVDGTLTVSPAPLTLTALANTKVFDGTTSAQALPTVTGLMSTDSVTDVFEAYADANPGTGKTLAVQSGFVIRDGNAGANYVVTRVPDVSGTIQALPVTVLPPLDVVLNTASNAPLMLATTPRDTRTTTTTISNSSLGVAVSTVKQAIEGAPGLVDVVVPTGTTSSGTSLVIALPDAVFANVTEVGATERVTLANKQPLPAWIRYDTASKTLITGAVPIGALPMAVLVTVGNQSTVVQISESQAKL